MIKAIIFDIGGVITFTDFQALYANFANRIGISSDIVSQYHKDHWADLLLANITLEQFFQDMQEAGAKPGLDLPIIWLEEALKIRKVNTELLSFIDELRKHYAVGVLSNLTSTRLVVDEALHLYDHFDFVVLSCKEHIKKPDPKFYEQALIYADAAASEVIFIDDNERNVAAAKNIGLNDITYTDNEQLRKDLANLGVMA